MWIKYEYVCVGITFIQRSQIIIRVPKLWNENILLQIVKTCKKKIPVEQWFVLSNSW